MASLQQRLADLLLAPREDLDCEIKNWLDLANSADAKATFAKAVLALANHGGGFVVFGLAQTTTGFTEAPDRPVTLDGYDQDLINGIVANYCDPALHCSVHFATAPDGAVHPIVTVPGGHRMPVRAKRASPDNKTVQNNAIYMRRPGPRSEMPQTSQDWDALLARCQNNRRDELFDQIRGLITGAVPQAPPAPEPDRLGEWMERSHARWTQLVDSVPAGTGPRMPHGRYSIGYEIIGDRKPVTLAQLPDVLCTSVVRHTGWPPFWLPTRPGITPYAMDGAIECWIGGDPENPPEQRDAAHADFWRIDPSGLAYLIRGYQEDDLGNRQGRRTYPPAAAFDLVIPVWRIGEAMLHAERLVANLFNGPTTIKFSVTYEGLAGRKLVTLDGRRVLFEGRTAHQDQITLTTHVDAQSIGSNLPEIVRPLLEPLYALFDFFVLPANLVTEELARMRSGRS
ncbi:AlbA family DNA-binding domain-containing protein [Xanthomonas arboricola]|uniref:AlbA family DNA-binding domain-containing protein n=1 Tax=Xanthomonas arboricola TaxID=56448 RepID=UPI001610611D|nr:hypothetical protein [Xanthomonas arboricola]MBB3761569.1 hypothetical protein [Xanthomonas arboricola]